VFLNEDIRKSHLVQFLCLPYPLLCLFDLVSLADYQTDITRIPRVASYVYKLIRDIAARLESELQPISSV